MREKKERGDREEMRDMQTDRQTGGTDSDDIVRQTDRLR